MGHIERFLEFARNELGDIDGDSLVNGPDTIEDVDDNLYTYGRYVIDRAKSLDPQLEVDCTNALDYFEHKNHFLQFYSDYEIGGRKYRVILDECEFLYGKMAEDALDFHNSTVAQIRYVIKNYHHVLNHVSPNLDDKAYNPGDSLPAGGSLDEYVKER